jgi:CBS domain-containing protein
MVSSTQVKGVMREEWPRTTVENIMTRMKEADALSPEDDAAEALSRMMSLGVGRLPVVSGGRVVGILSRGDAMELLKSRTDLGLRGPIIP